MPPPTHRVASLKATIGIQGIVSPPLFPNPDSHVSEYITIRPKCQLVNFRSPHPLTVSVRLGSWWMLMGGYLCEKFSRLLRMSSGRENVSGPQGPRPTGYFRQHQLPNSICWSIPRVHPNSFFSYWFMVSKIYFKFLWKEKMKKEKNTPYFMIKLVLSVSVFSNLLYTINIKVMQKDTNFYECCIRKLNCKNYLLFCFNKL